MAGKAPPRLDIALHGRQSLVFQSDAQEILYGGAAGGGKSFLVRAAALIWAMQIPGLQVYFFRRQFVDIELNHLSGPKSFMAMLAPFIETGWVKWNSTKNKFYFWNGSVLHLCHVQKDADMMNYLGAEMHVLVIDEFSQFTPAIYRFLRTRVRMVGLKIPEGQAGVFPRILLCSNPGGPCHGYMKEAWRIGHHLPGEIWKADPEDGGLTRQFIPAKIADNPSLEVDDPGYADRIRGLGDPVLIKAYLEGSFDVLSGGMFDDIFSDQVHIIKPFVIPRSWYIDRAFDMGTGKPFCVSWFAQSDGTQARMADGSMRNFPRGTIFQIGEWYGWNGKPDEGSRRTPDQIALGIKRIEEKFQRPVAPGPADTAIFDSDAYGNSVADAMVRAAGIQWGRADKRSGTRAGGWAMIRNHLSASIDPRSDRPGLYFFPNCVHTVRTMKNAIRGLVKVEDLMDHYEDHALDTLRYRILSGIMGISSSGFRAW